jgi:hypothetical protein
MAVTPIKRNIFMTTGKMEIMKELNSPKLNRHAATKVRNALISNKYLSTAKWPALVLTAALILLLSASGFDFSISPVLSSDYFGKLTNNASKIFTPTPSLPDNLQQNTASHAPLFFAGHDEDKPLVPYAVVEFLKTYSLSKFENAFYDALRFRQFKRVTEEIYRSTGYELIRLDYVPGFIRKAHVVLSYTLVTEGPESYFLFWRPLFRLNKFYYTYKGLDIFFLQKKLAAIKLYDQDLDGIVGPELLYAVVQFQKQMALQLTGYPDPGTLFLICQLAGKSQKSLIDGMS